VCKSGEPMSTLFQKYFKRNVSVHLADEAVQENATDVQGQTNLLDSEDVNVRAMISLAQDNDRLLLCCTNRCGMRLFAWHSMNGSLHELPCLPGGVSCASYSPSGRHFALGGCDGAVRLWAVEPFSLPDTATPFWEGQLHDMNSNVCGVHVSFDGCFLTAAATDGAMLTCRLNPAAGALQPGSQQKGKANIEYGLMSACALPECEEVAATGYTVEQAKQKLEQDHVLAAADAKKQSVREELEECAPAYPCMCDMLLLSLQTHR
jgi:hypothetical protein